MVLGFTIPGLGKGFPDLGLTFSGILEGGGAIGNDEGVLGHRAGDGDVKSGGGRFVGERLTRRNRGVLRKVRDH